MVSNDTKPPKKKRKIVPESLPDSAAEIQVEVLPGSDPMTVDEFPPTSKPQETLPALPRFPLPLQPEAPSPSVLYLQGVDQALIEAEIIDPRRTLALSSELAEDDSKLSLRTRQRLSQLGILELFAGMRQRFVLWMVIFIPELFLLSPNRNSSFPPTTFTNLKIFVPTVRFPQGSLCLRPYREWKDPCIRPTNRRGSLQMPGLFESISDISSARLYLLG